MQTSKRIEEELVLSEEEAIGEYDGITKIIGITYCLLSDQISQMVVLLKKGIILDLGTGLGNLAIEMARRFPDSQIFGLDISEKIVAQAQMYAQREGLNNIKFKLMDVHNLEFEDNSVDLITSHGSLHHWRNSKKVFTQIYRVLKTGGLGFIVDLRRDAPEEIVREVAGFLSQAQKRGFLSSIATSYLPKEIEDLLSEIGIKDFVISEQKFSRQVIIKNLSKIKAVSRRSDRFNKLYLNVIIKK